MNNAVIFPCLRYEDAPAAIDFLCNAFGFVRHAVYTDDQDPGIVHHAQLTLGSSMVMLSSARPGEYVERCGWKTVAEAGGITSCIAAYVASPDAHHDQAVAAGAEIVTNPHDNPGYPGRSYDARDPGGYVWNFGSYDPWAEAS